MSEQKTVGRKRKLSDAERADRAAKSKAASALRAEEIRATAALRRTLPPGSVLEGEVGWKYYAAPADDPGKTRAEARLADLGYEPAPGVRMIGIHRGMIWKIPQSIAEDLHAARGARLKIKN